MPSRATTGRHFRSEQGETTEGRAILADLTAKTTFISSRFEEIPHRRREQFNRENNRTITGAYQGDNRRQNWGGLRPRQSHMRRPCYACGAWLRGPRAGPLIQNGASIMARPRRWSAVNGESAADSVESQSTGPRFTGPLRLQPESRLDSLRAAADTGSVGKGRNGREVGAGPKQRHEIHHNPVLWPRARHMSGQHPVGRHGRPRLFRLRPDDGRGRRLPLAGLVKGYGETLPRR